LTEGLYSCIEVARTDNPVPAFSAAMEYWEKKRGSRFAPSWSDIELLDLPTSVIPNCIVLDLGADLQASRYRFYGSAVGDVHGMELSNRTISDVKPAAFREHILFQYQTVVEVREPRLFATLITVRSGARRQHYILRMPLSDDGDDVTNIFSIQDASDDRQELTDYFSAMAENSNAGGGEA